MTTPANTKPATPVKPASGPATPVPPQAPPVPPVPPADAKPTDVKPDVKPDEKPDEKPAKPAKPEMSMEDIGGGFILTAELATTTAPVRARNDRQRAMDTKVKELHALWVKAQKPSTWENMVKGGAVATYFLEPDKTADFHTLINRAVAFHGLRSRMGTAFKVTEKHIAKFNLPAQYLGREAVSFAILDKRPRATSDGKPASEIVKPATETTKK